ncbi:MAG: NUDIX domain-containing protein [Rhizobiaceae bacterium]|nr:NUDIX domain-containing protein [Rhizobiaceae bacterium]
MADELPILPAVSVALVRAGKVLLVKRGRPPVKGVYAFPGGRVEPGEDWESAARRELHEETGLFVDELRFVEEVLTDPERSSSMPSFRLRVFAGRDAGGTPIAADDAEEAGFYSLEELERLPLAGKVYEIARDLLRDGEEWTG